MKINEIVNSGFKQHLPVYYNKVSIVNYNLPENQIPNCKQVELNKYNSKGFITNKCNKHITRISNI